MEVREPPYDLRFCRMFNLSRSELSGALAHLFTLHNLTL